ncbi:TetR/AcrR family transcriptional regulator [Nocardia otitidiscaviarum]|uniref:TetR/AcrR family transcriptional regulator n=1 Tax=Nocardia otitidiscaviarum TaxID=1823 RepID=A0A379JM35_9NOCA|nr:TetR/AcrR family transcriptional regulator [Nocardia otitidiscaviarum]MBF6136831.1 TetR/AcrR family transcriptional regulator [Nocardia otitidiscaviarum]MBF6239307.1 TetR/AcrR family transcriptional regulator [Nocardia otitidiscaviarum]MBF6485034.1 TetR/AcrR family transcriptional regulator [Nocardia otitidiscaviarum]MCP9620556.1 TetR/AcrR family transcriptional regulator [Nocardia otitidiscaviarum]QDP79179.1 TetR/AcrR family transcriptional regulator [Nocardia otitidiscaviarum]
MLNPRATADDLTAKARIRNAAMDLFAQYGESRVSLRAVAAEAGVTLGLVQHHFKTKAGLIEAVDQLIVDYFAAAVSSVPPTGTTAQVATARDEAVRRMLHDNPAVVNYVRRAVLEPAETQLRLLESLVDLTRREITGLREAGLASTTRREPTQIVEVMVRQLGELLLAPMIDAVWERVADPTDTAKPRLTITVRD